MSNIEIYTKSWCPYCARAKALLQSRGLAFVEYEISSDSAKAREMRERSHGSTVPQIFIDDRLIGGSDELFAAHASGYLDQLLDGGPTIITA